MSVCMGGERERFGSQERGRQPREGIRIRAVARRVFSQESVGTSLCSPPFHVLSLENPSISLFQDPEISRAALSGLAAYLQSQGKRIERKRKRKRER